MKVYYIYAFFPNKIFKNISPFVSTMKNFKYNPSKDEWYGLYAASYDKKLAKWFMRTHDKKYFVLKKDDYDNSKKEFYEDFYLYMIKPIQMSYDVSDDGNGLKTMKLPLVNSEELMDPDTEDPEIGEKDPPFRIFKKKYQYALEVLYYTSFEILSAPSNHHVDDYEADIAEDNINFGVTYPSGLAIHIESNELAHYIGIYKDILSM